MELSEIENKILLLIDERCELPNPDCGLPVEDIVEALNIRCDTCTAHVSQLAGYGLVHYPLDGVIGLSAKGRDYTRSLGAAPERERQRRAEAQRRFWLTRGERLIWMLITLALGLLSLWLAVKMQLR